MAESARNRPSPFLYFAFSFSISPRFRLPRAHLSKDPAREWSPTPAPPMDDATRTAAPCSTSEDVGCGAREKRGAPAKGARVSRFGWNGRTLTKGGDGWVGGGPNPTGMATPASQRAPGPGPDSDSDTDSANSAMSPPPYNPNGSLRLTLAATSASRAASVGPVVAAAADLRRSAAASAAKARTWGDRWAKSERRGRAGRPGSPRGRRRRAPRAGAGPWWGPSTGQPAGSRPGRSPT